MDKTNYPGYEELSEISFAEVERLTKARLPLIIPWHPKQMVPLGTFFHSTKKSEEYPWAKNSPFDPSSLARTAMIVGRDYGSQSTFKSRSTSRSTQTVDHLELGFGVGVGLPFLASVTVHGDYCKDVQENKDSNKTSINFSTRAGSVFFERQPRLSYDAIGTIKYFGGLEAFHEKYGDYYLAGYRLGGDTGILVSGSNSFRKQLEKFGITVTVEVLFVEASVTHTKDVLTTSAGSEVKVIGYDTLGYTRYNSSAENDRSSVADVRNQAEDYVEEARNLDLRVSDKLDELEIRDGDVVDESVCRELVEAGLVVELMLLPAITLRDVQNWVIEDDVI
ncbi:Hypothetical predicted protein [Lecanosticta acicola]|uniref:Uncharacterized protein n=1 Tax=Lecanosticta acicola TaxID=111012 RepID=A0AAI8YZL6_9PEZI|nr:Hypothetical predicted protein [Lecanosticta acicola]